MIETINNMRNSADPTEKKAQKIIQTFIYFS